MVLGLGLQGKESAIAVAYDQECLTRLSIVLAPMVLIRYMAR